MSQKRLASQHRVKTLTPVLFILKYEVMWCDQNTKELEPFKKISILMMVHKISF